MVQILLIEDERGIAEAVADKLRQIGYAVDVKSDGLDGLFVAQQGIYDLIILDVMLPSLDGFEILKKLRESNIPSKIIMLTALSSLEDKLAGFQYGANDYLPKPFHIDELLARIKAQLGSDGGNSEVQFADLKFSKSSAEISTASKSIQLSAKEAQILNLFLTHPEQVFSQNHIYEKLWGADAEPGSNSLEVYISFLRKKLKALGAHAKIITLRGIGYKLTGGDHE